MVFEQFKFFDYAYGYFEHVVVVFVQEEFSFFEDSDLDENWKLLKNLDVVLIGNHA